MQGGSVAVAIFQNIEQETGLIVFSRSLFLNRRKLQCMLVQQVEKVDSFCAEIH
jgi:hypothetical protein